MGPKFSQGFCEGLEVQSDQENSSEEEQEESLFDITPLLLLENLNHFFHELIQLVLKVIVVTGEYQESNSLHSVAFLSDNSIVVREQSSLEIPFLHLLFKDFIWLGVNEVLHNLLPLLEVQHAHREEGVKVEKINNFSPVWLDETWVDLVRLFDN